MGCSFIRVSGASTTIAFRSFLCSSVFLASRVLPGCAAVKMSQQQLADYLRKLETYLYKCAPAHLCVKETFHDLRIAELYCLSRTSGGLLQNPGFAIFALHYL